MSEQEMTLDQLEKFLSQDKELDLSLFGKKGYRPLSYMLKEINAQDIRIVFDESIGRIILVRISVWGLLETDDGYSLIEIERWRPNGRILGIFRRWKHVKKDKEYSLSETIRTGKETELEALIRGIEEEWRLFIRHAKINPKHIVDTKHALAESSVYPRTLTRRYSKMYRFTLPRRPVIWNPIAVDKEDDEEVLMLLTWIYRYKNEKLGQKALRLVLSAYYRYVVLRIRYLV